MNNTIYLNKDREKSILRGHPWIFSGAVKKLEGTPQPGDTVDVLSHDGKFLAHAGYSPESQIRLRIWNTCADENIDEEFFRRRITAAVSKRNPFDGENNCVRLFYAESDGIPGLITDKYDKTLVFQFLFTGAEKWKKTIVESFMEITSAESAFERSDTSERKMEGLPAIKGLLMGKNIEGPVEVLESGARYLVDVEKGHKTGFYLDQRENRHLLRNLCRGKRVLNCFCYTGGFAINAVLGGCDRVVSVDSSKPAINTAIRNADLNRVDPAKCAWIEEDVFSYLRNALEKHEKFDIIVLDPPKFARSRGDVEKALRGYKDINMMAMRLLKPGGHLLTFSCSGNISEEDFRRMLAWAGMDAGVRIQAVRPLCQSPDHPVMLNFPESMYLKGLLAGIYPVA